MSLSAVIHDKLAKDAYPDSALLAKTRVSFRLNRPVGLFFTYYSSVIKEANTDPIIVDPHDWPCRAFHTAHSLDFEGHVISTDPAALEEPSLQRLWMSGRKQRTLAHPMGLLDAVEAGLNEYIERAARISQRDISVFDR